MLSKNMAINSARRQATTEQLKKSVSTVDPKKSKENLTDSVTEAAFWNGVSSASIIQQEPLVRNVMKTKFKQPEKNIEKIVVDNSKEVREI